jgi:hypothetical protein
LRYELDCDEPGDQGGGADGSGPDPGDLPTGQPVAQYHEPQISGKGKCGDEPQQLKSVHFVDRLSGLSG